MIQVVFETIHGSRAYGLAREGSDEDRKGIAVGPRDWYFSPQGGPEQIEESADRVCFEIRKFFRLAIGNNPTLLEMLFTDPSDWRVITPAGEAIVAERDRFLSRRVAGTFGGYALSQLKRIETHRRWLLHPPKAAPERASFGLPERPPISRDQIGAAEALMAQDRLHDEDLDPQFLELLAREKRYRAARREWEQYRAWLRDRNPKRAALEAQFGYDTKHAMHLVRLCRMAIEILAHGEVRVRRADRDELLAIRDGKWSYDALIESVATMRDDIARAQERSALPEAPDEPWLNALCVRVIEDVLGCGRES
jgi:uncharacterized protein